MCDVTVTESLTVSAEKGGQLDQMLGLNSGSVRGLLW